MLRVLRPVTSAQPARLLLLLRATLKSAADVPLITLIIFGAPKEKKVATASQETCNVQLLMSSTFLTEYLLVCQKNAVLETHVDTEELHKFIVSPFDFLFFVFFKSVSLGSQTKIKT